MARKIRPPKQVTDEIDARDIVADARHIAEIVSRYSRFTEQHVLECIMRVVGHLCAIGEYSEEKRSKE